MKCVTGLLLVLLFGTASAADVTIDADGDPNATSYRIYKRAVTDAAWLDSIDVPAFPAIYPNVSDSGITMFKACSLNAVAVEFCRDEAGAWYDADSVPLTMQGVRIP